MASTGLSFQKWGDLLIYVVFPAGAVSPLVQYVQGMKHVETITNLISKSIQTIVPHLDTNRNMQGLVIKGHLKV
jgi:hypothetical protein